MRPANGALSGGHLSHRQVLVVLSGLLLGMFLAALDQNIVATALRTIGDDLDGQSAQAWVTTAYLVTSTVTTPLYGKLSDTYGRKPFYLFAIAVFVVGSMLCGTADSIYQLAGYRAIQGVGAGGLMALAFAIIGDIVPARERGRYIGYFMSVFATASVLGPVLGGFLAGADSLLTITGWRWIFYVNVPVGVLALLVVFRVLNLPHLPRQNLRTDYWGAALLSATVIPLLLVTAEGRQWGWSSPLTLCTITLSLGSLAAFVRVQQRMGEDAILPLRVFSSSAFTVGSTVSFIVGMALFGGLAALPLYLQIVRGQSPTAAGLLLTPLMIGIIVSATFSGQVIARTGRYKALPIAGTALLILAMSLFAMLDVDTPLWQASVFMVVMGLGLGLSMQTLTIAVQNSLPPRDMGVATSSVTFFRSMGGAFGAAVFLAVLFGTLGGHVRDRLVEAGAPAELLSRFDSADALNDTTVIATLPEAARRAVLEGFADSMHLVFVIAALVLVPAFLLALRLKEVPLRDSAGLPAAQAERAKAETAIV